MDSNASPSPGHQAHVFTSADGTRYVWYEEEEASLTLEKHEIDWLRDYITQTPDEVLQNDESGNGIPMGVKLNLSSERLQVFTDVILGVVRLRDNLRIHLTEHASTRLENDMLNGEEHEDYRGWESEEMVRHCVLSIEAVGSARLTVNKRTSTTEEIAFNSKIALEVRGTKPDGTTGTLALAIVDDQKIRIITLL
jgi:hypothetical protein